MTQRLLRVAVALVTFAAGAAAATIFNAVFGSSPAASRYNYISPTSYHSRGGCSKKWRSRTEEFVPPPALPVPAESEVTTHSDVPPPPAPPKPVIKKRITIKLPDGTVRVIESSSETSDRK